MAGKKQTNSTPISIRIENDRLEHLRMMSHKLSLERNQDLSYIDLIRMAIEQVFPMPSIDNKEHPTTK